MPCAPCRRSRAAWQGGVLATSAALVCALLVAACLPKSRGAADGSSSSAAQPLGAAGGVEGVVPATRATGHTGLVSTFASTTTVAGKRKLEGAMIPRFCQADFIEQPTTAAEVAALLRRYKQECGAQGKGLRVRASRALYHASSDLLCPETNAPDTSSSTTTSKQAAHKGGAKGGEGEEDAGTCSLIVDTNGMSALVSLDRERMLVTTGPAHLLSTLMEHLYQHGLALDYKHLPFYSNLTVAGMLLTGAHGSARDKPSSFGQLVHSVTWVDALGRVHITTGTTHPTVTVKELIGSNGLYGVVTEMTMRLVPLYKLKATVRRMHDFQLKNDIQKVLANEDVALIQWLPDVFQAVIMTRTPVPADTKGTAEFQVLEGQPLLGPPGAITMGMNQFDNAILGNPTTLDDLPICLAELVLIPYYRDEFTKLPIPDHVPAIGRLPVMAAGDCVPSPEEGCFWRQIPINLVEVDIPLAVLPDWMDDVRAIMQKEVPTCLPSVIGFAMRFGAASDSPMDMAYGRDTVYVDIVSNKGPSLVDAPSSYQHVFDQVEQLTFCKYGARPHWGKNSNRAFMNPRCPAADTYERIDRAFLAAREFDPEGAFVSPMMARVMARTSAPKTPGCAVRHECYCDADVDCGPGYACVDGATFPEYKVCKSKHLSLRHQASAAVKDAVLRAMSAASRRDRL